MDPIDWANAPRTALWWAMDKNGRAHWFCEPDVLPYTEFWFAEMRLAPSFGFEGDWRESLVMRPNERATWTLKNF